jgi:uncharacterized zinc-type alcohol dehydrogenase-like protein
MSSAPVRCYAAGSAKSTLEAWSYDAGALGAHQVEIRVTHCGICHSDLSMIDNEWGMSQYPLVPGHEVVGELVAVGRDVDGLKVGQRVGLGWQSGSCAACSFCERGKEHLCFQAESTIVHRHGGYADTVRCDAKFALPVPEAISSEHAGPLMCAGSTVYTPMAHHLVRPNMSTAVVGIGGLGHLAVQFLNKWGCEVTAISTTHNKEAEARQLGAHHFIASKDAGALESAASSFDWIICTVSADSDWNALINTLRPEGTLVVVGLPETDVRFQAFPMINSERSIAGGRLGSPSDGKDMLDFAARHGIRPMIELFPMSQVNAAIERVRSGKVRYRAVLAN